MRAVIHLPNREARVSSVLPLSLVQSTAIYIINEQVEAVDRLLHRDWGWWR